MNNKKVFLNLSGIINNLKGNKKVFDYLFRSFTNITISDEDNNISVDRINIEYNEYEDWWNDDDIKYYDGVHDHDGSGTYKILSSKPFSYEFVVDQSRDIILPLVEKVHPAGFQCIFTRKLDFEEDIPISDSINLIVTYGNFYASGEPNYRNNYFNDQEDFSGEILLNLTF